MEKDRQNEVQQLDALLNQTCITTLLRSGSIPQEEKEAHEQIEQICAFICAHAQELRKRRKEIVQFLKAAAQASHLLTNANLELLLENGILTKGEMISMINYYLRFERRMT